MRVIIAPNAFKGSLRADQAAEAIRCGLKRSVPQCECEIFPVGDGGDGTGALLIERLGGRRVTAKVKDPLGRTVDAEFGIIDREQTAVIELAEASGLRRLRAGELNPLRSTTFGTGQLMRAALDEGAGRLILAVGGSATVDGGTGILQALGARFVDKDGRVIIELPERLAELDSIDLSGLDPRALKCELMVLCDVENPLLGDRGAARVFGPQKGATPSAVATLESALSQFSTVLRRQTGTEVAGLAGGGAAGGVAAGLCALLKAKLVNGIDYFLDVAGFDEALARCDLVITGEGRMDAQTLHGKAPMGVALRARRRGIKVVAFAGSVESEAEGVLRVYFDNLLRITPEGVGMETALRETGLNLEKAAYEFGKSLAAKPSL